MVSWIKRIPELLYPRRCPLCDGILGEKEPYLCKNCGKTLHFVQEPRCCTCGKPVRKEEEELCPDCRKRTHLYTQGFAPFLYRGDIQKSILRMKYGGRAEYSAFYARAMAEYGKAFLERVRPELLIPVPLHRSRQNRRGYNQAELLAKELSKQVGIPAETGLVLRRKKTGAQKNLDERARRENLAQAFAWNGPDRCLQRVLLVDDIYTTGSTVDEMADVCLRHGVQEVYVACACISP